MLHVTVVASCGSWPITWAGKRSVCGPEIDEEVPVDFREVLKVDERVLVVTGKAEASLQCGADKTLMVVGGQSTGGRGFPSSPICCSRTSGWYRRYRVSSTMVWPGPRYGRGRRRWRRTGSWELPESPKLPKLAIEKSGFTQPFLAVGAGLERRIVLVLCRNQEFFPN